MSEQRHNFTWEAPPSFNYPPPTLKQDGNFSWYEDHLGRRLKRATTVIKTGKPFDPTYWFAMCGGDELGKLNQLLTLKTGELVHKIIEYYLRNGILPDWQYHLAKKAVENLQPALDNIDNIYYCEQPLSSDKLVVGGTVDCIAEYHGVKSIIDFKTSAKKKSIFDINQYLLQTALYARIWHEMTGQKIEQVVILMAVYGGPRIEFIKPVSEIDDKLDKVLIEGGYMK